MVCASWSGLGIFLITLLEYLAFEQVLDWRGIAGLLLIVAAVVLVNRFAPHKEWVTQSLADPSPQALRISTCWGLA